MLFTDNLQVYNLQKGSTAEIILGQMLCESHLVAFEPMNAEVRAKVSLTSHRMCVHT